MACLRRSPPVVFFRTDVPITAHAIIAPMIIIKGSPARWRRLVGMILSLIGSAFAATGPIKSFDIAAGPAESALKQFAVQSGLEVLFSTEVARGVQTNALKGNFAPDEAVRQMLTGTSLRVVNEGKNGVLR